MQRAGVPAEGRRKVIRVTRLDGRTVVVNVDRIEYLEATPDTVICFESGQRLVVREPPEEIIRRVIAYKRQIHTWPEGVE